MLFVTLNKASKLHIIFGHNILFLTLRNVTKRKAISMRTKGKDLGDYIGPILWEYHGVVRALSSQRRLNMGFSGIAGGCSGDS